MTKSDRGANKDESGDVAGEGKTSWNQRASAYVSELQAEIDRLKAPGDLKDGDTERLDKADQLLIAAREALEKWDTPWSSVRGSTVDRVWSNIHHVELLILKVVDGEDFAGWATEILARTRQHLGAEDPLRRELEKQVDSNRKRRNSRFRDLAARALRAANDAQDLERARLRSFRNILITSITVTSALCALLIIYGYVEPAAVAQNLCFHKPPPHNKEASSCPIGDSPAGGSDVLVVEFFGLCGATLAGAISLRHMRGTATPYMVPICLLLLRLPIGALAAVFGILIIKGDFVPGLSNLDSSAQILAWSLAFGIGQETVTRLIDEQGRKIIGNVRGPSRGFDDDLKSMSVDDGPAPPKGPPVSAGRSKRILYQVFRWRS